MGDANAKAGKLAYWVLAALFAMNLLNYVDRFILASVITPVQESLGFAGQEAKAGALSTVFFISYALFSPLFGWLGDRVTRKYLLAVGVGIWSVATFGSGLAESYAGIVLARSVLGVGEAAYATLAPTLLADLFPRDKRNRIMAIFYSAIPLGAALGYALGGLIVEHHKSLTLLPLIESALQHVTGQHFEETSRGWRMAFFVVGLPGLVVALAALFIREPRRGASEGVTDHDLSKYHALPLSAGIYIKLLRNRSYIYNALGMAMFTFALGGLQYWTPKYLSSGIGAMTLSEADLRLGVVIVLSGLVGTLMGAWLSDRWARSHRGAYFWLSGVSMLGAIPFIALALFGGLYGWHWLVIFGSILVGLTLAFFNFAPSNTIIVNVTAPRIRAAALAVNLFVIHLLGDIPSPYMMGKIADLRARRRDRAGGSEVQSILGSGNYDTDDGGERRVLLPGRAASGSRPGGRCAGNAIV